MGADLPETGPEGRAKVWMKKMHAQTGMDLTNTTRFRIVAHEEEFCAASDRFQSARGWFMLALHRAVRPPTPSPEDALRLVTRVLACAVLALACAGAAAQPSGAAGYPSKPVRLVIPFAPGASTDILSRLAADELSKRLGVPFVAENVTGAGGTIGTAQVAKAAPDGYTLVGATPGPITISPVAQKGLQYDVKELRAVTLIAEGPGALVVRKDSKFLTVKDL